MNLINPDPQFNRAFDTVVSNKQLLPLLTMFDHYLTQLKSVHPVYCVRYPGNEVYKRRFRNSGRCWIGLEKKHIMLSIVINLGCEENSGEDCLEGT